MGILDRLGSMEFAGSRTFLVAYLGANRIEMAGNC
jgi:hypothetical protein